MQNLRGIQVQTMQATDTKPVRIKLTDIRFGNSVTIGYTATSESEQTKRAVEYLQSIGITVTAQTWCEKKQPTLVYHFINP